MALGHTASKAVKINNTTTTVTRIVELVVVDQQLVPDGKDSNPGVNTITM